MKKNRIKIVLLLQALCLMVFIVFVSGCKKNEIVKDTPTCIETSIKEFSKNNACASAKVSEYIFQNKHVYAFDLGLCGADMASEIKDAQCNTLGYLGGIMGNTVINDQEFSTAQFVKVVWVQK